MVKNNLPDTKKTTKTQNLDKKNISNSLTDKVLLEDKKTINESTNQSKNLLKTITDTIKKLFSFGDKSDDSKEQNLNSSAVDTPSNKELDSNDYNRQKQLNTDIQESNNTELPMAVDIDNKVKTIIDGTKQTPSSQLQEINDKKAQNIPADVTSNLEVTPQQGKDKAIKADNSINREQQIPINNTIFTGPDIPKSTTNSGIYTTPRTSE